MKPVLLRSIMIISVLMFGLSPGICSAETTRIGILPFAVTSESGLNHLSTGMIDLLSSRLAVKNEVDIVDRNSLKASTPPFTLTQAVSAGKSAKADFIISGTLIETIKGISISVSVADINTGNEKLSFDEKSGKYETADVIIPLVNRIADKINRGLFSKETPETTESIDMEESHNIHEHPDKLIKTLDLKEKE